MKQLSLETINSSSPYDVIVDYVSEFNNTVNMFMLKPEHEPAGLINKGDYVMNIEEKKQILCVASRLLGNERQNT